VGYTTLTTLPVRGERLTLKREWQLFTVMLIALDSLTVLLGLWFAYTLRVSSGLLTYLGQNDPGAYRALSFYSLPIWLVLFVLLGLYQRDMLLGGTQEYRQVLKACTAGIIGVMIMSFLWRDQFILVSRGWLLMAWALCCTMVFLERFVSRRVGYALRREGWLTHRALIVGANNQGLAMSEQWLSAPTSGIRVIGFLDDFKAIGTEVFNGLQVLGRPRHLHELARQFDVDEVVVVPNAIAWETFEEIIIKGSSESDFVMRLSPGFYEIMSTSVAVTNRSFVPLFTVHDNRLVGVDAAVKAVEDFGVGLPLLLLSAPWLAIAALALKIADPDLPVLERTCVAAPGGHSFKMARFRTRRPDGSASTLGRWLEQSEMDRLPQLWHVFTGRMSMIGPKPVASAADARDARAIHNQRTLKPGIIGPWSVWAEWAPGENQGYDLYYIRNWTPWLDGQILFQATVLGIRQTWHWLRRA
jgi:putative colanic acid biosynthesis UDP-glucose lipid carrier transferase